MESNIQQYMPLIYVLVSLMAPILPALAIYRLLPSSTSVEGPFHGLQIKLGGAFGGYFLLVIMSLAFLRSSPPTDNSFQVWRVHGKVKLAPASNIDTRKARFFTQPEPLTIDRAGNFALAVVARRGHAGQLELPSVVIEYGDEYDSATLPLDASQPGGNLNLSDGQVITFVSDSAAKDIKITEEVTLREKPRAATPYLANSTDAQQGEQVNLEELEGKQ